MEEIVDVYYDLSLGVGIDAVACYAFRRSPVEKALSIPLCRISDMPRLCCSPVEVVDVSNGLCEVEVN